MRVGVFFESVHMQSLQLELINTVCRVSEFPTSLAVYIRWWALI